MQVSLSCFHALNSNGVDVVSKRSGIRFITTPSQFTLIAKVVCHTLLGPVVQRPISANPGLTT